MASSVSPHIKSDKVYDYLKVQVQAEEAAIAGFEKEIGIGQGKPYLERNERNKLADRRNAKFDTASNVLKAGPKRNGDINVKDVRNAALSINLTTWNPTARKDSVVDKDIQLLRRRIVERRGIVENVKIPPRVYVPQIRTRDSSSIAESDGANKRQKVMVCDFYAKGWCLKGASCRFTHVKACEFYAKGWCFKGASCRFAHVKEVAHVKEGPDATVKKSEDKSGVACHRKVTGSSKAHFRAFPRFEDAIIEHVKELMVPAWQKGFMSKDTYKLIVKKSVDKVLSSFQRQLVPITPYQIKSYISRSQSKLAKLVEAYVIKYGKP